MKKNIAFLGFGNVGKALAKLLLKKRAQLIIDYSLDFLVTGIATSSHGTAINPDGLDLELILKDGAALQDQSKVSHIIDSFDFIRKSQADVLFETTPVNYQTGQPAMDYIRSGLENGMHIITANKGPVVHGYRALTKLAHQKGKQFYFEAAVMDGAPIFSLFRETLPAANLTSFKGILNSTTNMILTRMEEGDSFDEAVAYCQKIGIAETDPSGDVDGWDAAVKVSALVNVLMGGSIKPADVEREGIRKVSSEDIFSAKERNMRWKLLCSAEKVSDGFNTWVRPELVGIDSPLYQVNGTTSMVEFQTDVLGNLSIFEKDPSPHTTAYGLLADFINAVKK